jgi:hypothetical protein
MAQTGFGKACCEEARHHQCSFTGQVKAVAKEAQPRNFERTKPLDA